MIVNIKPIGQLFSAWQSVLITVILLVLVGFFAIGIMKKAPVQPLTIYQGRLNADELQSLQDTLESHGQVQFFGADLHKIHDTVAKLSWVESADIRRDWYQGVVVSVTPRKAVANFGSQQQLDANGVVFVPANPDSLMDKGLVTLYGDAPDAPEIMQQVQRINTWFAPLGLNVRDLMLTSRHTWIIRFDNGFRVIVDNEHTEQKLYSLSKTLKDKFPKQLSQMQSVDLRYKNGFAIAWKQKPRSI